MRNINLLRYDFFLKLSTFREKKALEEDSRVQNGPTCKRFFGGLSNQNYLLPEEFGGGGFCLEEGNEKSLTSGLPEEFGRRSFCLGKAEREKLDLGRKRVVGGKALF